MENTTVQMPTVNGRVDEAWLDSVLRENAARAAKHMVLTPEYGRICIYFTDVVMNDGELGFCRLDKLTKAEACSLVYMYVCKKADKYDHSKCSEPSNWIYTLVKNEMIHAVKKVLRTDEISEAIALVVGSETISRLDGIDRNAPIKKVISDKFEALRDFKFTKDVKEHLFTQTWRESWYRRDGKTVLQRAKRHNRLQAARVAAQVDLSETERDELKKLIEERRNGRN